MSILIFIVILLVLVLVHEAGHFFTAKKFGIRVDEFGFGFPPKLFGYKKGETEYTFNLLPLGGFVKIHGENPNEENTNGPDKGRSFANKPAWQQAVVLIAGVFANFLLAWVLFSWGLFAGIPTSVGNEVFDYPLENVQLVIVSVSAQSPASQVGLQSGDAIVSLRRGEEKVENLTPEALRSFVSSGEEIEVGYHREGQAVSYVKILPERDAPEDGPKIGVTMDQIGVVKMPVWLALKEGMKLTIGATKDTTVGLYKLIADSVKGQGSLDSVTGPVGLVGIVGDAYVFGFAYLLSFTAVISINLAVINLMPFPALDGGRLFFLLIEKIKGSPVNPKFFNIANIIGFSLLILFMVAVTYHDITNIL